MKRILLVVAMSMTLSACSDERLYQILGSPPPQGPPTIYPMNFPVCRHERGTVVVPLGIIFYGDSFPNPEYAMMLAKKNPGRDICEVIRKKSVYTIPNNKGDMIMKKIAGMALALSGFMLLSGCLTLSGHYSTNRR